MYQEKRKELLLKIHEKLSLINAEQSDFHRRTIDILDSLIELHVFDSNIDFKEKEIILQKITEKIIDVKKDKSKNSKSRKELIELYKKFLK